MQTADNLTSIQDVFSAPWMYDTTEAIVFRLPKKAESYHRNWDNIPAGRTDWWRVASSRRTKIDAVILLIDSKRHSNLIEIYAGRFSGDYEINKHGGMALFAEGGFLWVGSVDNTRVRDFYGKQPGNQFTYISSNAQGKRSRKAGRVLPTFLPTFKKEFAGQKAKVLPRSFSPGSNHGVAMNKLHEWLLSQEYSAADNNPWDMSTKAPNGERWLFELKTTSSNYDTYTAVGQLFLYEHEFERRYGIKHDKRIVVLPDEAASRQRLHSLRAIGVELLLFTESFTFRWPTNQLYA